MEPGAALDNVLASMRRGAGAFSEAPPPDDVVGRFMVTKASWRGRYRRVLVVTRSAVLTLHPEDGSVTNGWQFSGEADLDGARPSGGLSDDLEFILSTRKDNKVSC